MGAFGSRGRCLGVLVLLTAVATALLALVLPIALAPADPASFVDLLVRTCAVAASVGVAWLWLGAALVGVSVLARTPAPPVVPGVPAAVRRLVLAGCGVALAAPGWPALAAGAVPDLPVPDRALGALAPERLDAAGRTGGGGPGGGTCAASRLVGSGRGARTARVATVTVEPGDSLWTIARRDLGGTASDGAVDAHWRALYARNSAVVGADPDLVLPGQRLRLPALNDATDPVR